MVSFVCNTCQETIKKPKLDAHAAKCEQASFSCVDCSTSFTGNEYRNHKTCMSEAEKYQKSLYKEKKNPQNKSKNEVNSQTPSSPSPSDNNPEPKESSEKSNHTNQKIEQHPQLQQAKNNPSNPNSFEDNNKAKTKPEKNDRKRSLNEMKNSSSKPAPANQKNNAPKVAPINTSISLKLNLKMDCTEKESARFYETLNVIKNRNNGHVTFKILKKELRKNKENKRMAKLLEKCIAYQAEPVAVTPVSNSSNPSSDQMCC